MVYTGALPLVQVYLNRCLLGHSVNLQAGYIHLEKQLKNRWRAPSILSAHSHTLQGYTVWESPQLGSYSTNDLQLCGARDKRAPIASRDLASLAQLLVDMFRG